MLDFDQEARRLRAALGLDGGKPTHEFHDLDRLWVDTKTGGAIWVGNENAAKGPLSEFERHDIAAVVNCTDDMPNFLEGAGRSTTASTSPRTAITAPTRRRSQCGSANYSYLSIRR